MEKLNKQMDDALNTKVTALNATDDETGDGKVDALDRKRSWNCRISKTAPCCAAKSGCCGPLLPLWWCSA